MDSVTATRTGLRLSLELALDMVVCGIALAGSCLVARHLEPDLPRLPLLAGVAGGILCILWGVAGRLGYPHRLGAIVTLALAGCVLGYQVVRAWPLASEGNTTGRMAAVLLVAPIAFCVGMLINLVRAKQAQGFLDNR
jgi:hypothetical protein